MAVMLDDCAFSGFGAYPAPWQGPSPSGMKSAGTMSRRLTPMENTLGEVGRNFTLPYETLGMGAT